MLNKLRQFIRRYDMLQPGDQVVCAVSGGADSVALLFALYLLQEKMQIKVSAAHFNHGLRGTESDGDEAFVCDLCNRLDIPVTVGRGNVAAGKKGLEAAAREARYAFLHSLPGKIATAHTANDNAETVLMHLVRGTGLCGLGGIAPVNGRLIRPMLEVTRNDVISFLQEYHLNYVTDSSNGEDQFLRNRLRHHVMPLLEKENPHVAESISISAQRLRQDEVVLSTISNVGAMPSVTELRRMPEPVRRRVIRSFLENNGLNELEARQIHAVEQLIFSDKPSASASFRGGIVIARNYDRITLVEDSEKIRFQILDCPGEVALPSIGITITCRPATKTVDLANCFTVLTKGQVFVRHRLPGDRIRLIGGTKELKKLFIDKKIPARERLCIPVIADDLGVIAVYGVGVNRERISEHAEAVEISFVEERKEEERL